MDFTNDIQGAMFMFFMTAIMGFMFVFVLLLAFKACALQASESFFKAFDLAVNSTSVGFISLMLNATKGCANAVETLTQTIR